jgi:hypothetical protein
MILENRLKPEGEQDGKQHRQFALNMKEKNLNPTKKWKIRNSCLKNTMCTPLAFFERSFILVKTISLFMSFS